MTKTNKKDWRDRLRVDYGSHIWIDDDEIYDSEEDLISFIEEVINQESKQYEMLKAYLEAGGDPDYVIVSRKDMDMIGATGVSPKQLEKLRKEVLSHVAQESKKVVREIILLLEDRVEWTTMITRRQKSGPHYNGHEGVKTEAFKGLIEHLKDEYLKE